MKLGVLSCLQCIFEWRENTVLFYSLLRVGLGLTAKLYSVPPVKHEFVCWTSGHRLTGVLGSSLLSCTACLVI